MAILKHVISIRVPQKKFKLCQPRAANSITKGYHANFTFNSASNFSHKTILFDKGFCDFSQLSLTVSWSCWLIFVCQRYKNLRFDVFLHFSWPNWKVFKLSHHPTLPSHISGYPPKENRNIHLFWLCHLSSGTCGLLKKNKKEKKSPEILSFMSLFR